MLRRRLLHLRIQFNGMRLFRTMAVTQGVAERGLRSLREVARTHPAENAPVDSNFSVASERWNVSQGEKLFWPEMVTTMFDDFVAFRHPNVSRSIGCGSK